MWLLESGQPGNQTQSPFTIFIESGTEFVVVDKQPIMNYFKKQHKFWYSHWMLCALNLGSWKGNPDISNWKNSEVITLVRCYSRKIFHIIITINEKYNKNIYL